MPSPVLIPPQLAEAYGGGISILVGTRDANLAPDASKGIGVVVHPDRHRLTIFVSTLACEQCIANARDNGMIAVAFSSALDHQTTQVKGKVIEVRDATEAEREIIERYKIALTEVLAVTGLSRAVIRGVRTWPATAITFEVHEIYQQTPGPGAGEPLQAAR